MTASACWGHGAVCPRHPSEERECARLAEAGSSVIHCPTSNTFLGSGLFDIGHVEAERRPVAVGVATDIAGGTSYSMLATLGEAYKVAMLKGRRFTAGDAFAMATRGNAERVGLEATGSLDRATGPTSWCSTPRHPGAGGSR